MQGTVVKIAVEEGQQVETGDLVIVLEAMKTEKQQVEEFLAAQEMAGYLGVLKKRAKAEILKPVAAAKGTAKP